VLLPVDDDPSEAVPLDPGHVAPSMMPHRGADAGLPRQGPELLVEACRAEVVGWK